MAVEVSDAYFAKSKGELRVSNGGESFIEPQELVPDGYHPSHGTVSNKAIGITRVWQGLKDGVDLKWKDLLLLGSCHSDSYGFTSVILVVL